MRQCIKNLHPRTSHEVRHISFYNFPSMTLHPRTFRKVRPIARYSQDLLWYLHPRTPVRCDSYSEKQKIDESIFTSTHLSRGATARYSVWRYAFTISRINIPTQIGLLTNTTPYVPLFNANLPGLLVRFGFARVSQIIISTSLHLKYLLHP